MAGTRTEPSNSTIKQPTARLSAQADDSRLLAREHFISARNLLDLPLVL